MKEKQNGEVWVLAEQEGNLSNRASYELLAWGRKLADEKGSRLAAVIIRHDTEKPAASLIRFGADTVYAADSPKFAHFLPDAFANVLYALVKKSEPDILIAPATTFGRTVMPLVASLAKTGLTADCTELKIDKKTGLLLQTRPAIGGNVMATIITPNTKPQMATVRPNARKPLPEDSSRTGEIVFEKFPEDALESRTRFVKFKADEIGEPPLQEADVIVAGGKGLKSEKNFEMLRELAEILGGTVGASREAVDMGWVPYSKQIGLSGKTVSPRLYIAAGISGAVQHIAGMSSSETVVAINTDPDANIFKVCDFGIVGDLFEIIPELIKKIKSEKGGKK